MQVFVQSILFALVFLIFSDFLRVFCRVVLPFLCVTDVTYVHTVKYQHVIPPPRFTPQERRSTLSNNFFIFFIFLPYSHPVENVFQENSVFLAILITP